MLANDELNIFFVGNPGTGKSTICNVFGASFESGLSFGNGLTKEVQIFPTTIDGVNVNLIDGPGLHEALCKVTIENAKEITKALRKDGNFKIIFLVKLDSLRVRLQDVMMIKDICNSINYDMDQIGLIINKVSEEELKKLKEDKNGLSIILSVINCATGLSFNKKNTTMIDYYRNLDNENENSEMNKAIKIVVQKLVEELIEKKIKVKPEGVKPSFDKEEMQKELDEHVRNVNDTINKGFSKSDRIFTGIATLGLSEVSRATAKGVYFLDRIIGNSLGEIKNFMQNLQKLNDLKKSEPK